MKTRIHTTRTYILDLLKQQDELKISPLYLQAVESLASEGLVSQRMEGEFLIVRKALN